MSRWSTQRPQWEYIGQANYETYMIAAYFPGTTVDSYSSLLIQINMLFSGHDECSILLNRWWLLWTYNTYILYIHIYIYCSSYCFFSCHSWISCDDPCSWTTWSQDVVSCFLLLSMSLLCIEEKHVINTWWKGLIQDEMGCS